MQLDQDGRDRKALKRLRRLWQSVGCCWALGLDWAAVCPALPNGVSTPHDSLPCVGSASSTPLADKAVTRDGGTARKKRGSR